MNLLLEINPRSTVMNWISAEESSIYSFIWRHFLTTMQWQFARLTLQKRVIKMISKSILTALTDPIFIMLKICKLIFENIIKLQIGKVMYL